MKKIALLALALVSQIAAYAYEYPYLVFLTHDGSMTSVDVDGLDITVSDGKLIATDSLSSTSFELGQLSKMYFSTSTTGISKIDKAEGEVEVYSVQGVSLGKYNGISEAKSNLKPGIYVIKDKVKTIKLSVR